MEIPLDTVIDRLSNYYGVEKIYLTKDYYYTLPFWQRNRHNYLKGINDYTTLIHNLKNNIDNIRGYNFDNSDTDWELKDMEDNIEKLEDEIYFMSDNLKIDKDELVLSTFCVAAII